MIYLSNAFSTSMLDFDDGMAIVEFREADPPAVADMLSTAKGDWVSCVGHADTARIISSILGIEVPVNRASVKLAHGDELIVAQYIGPRLPEGATQLPEGAEIRFVAAFVRYD